MDIEYKGFIAKVSFSPDTDSFAGEVLNSTELLAFQVSNPAEASQALQMTVDSYLQQIALVETT